MKKNPIVFLHLSDLHLNNETDINDNRIIEIVDSLNGYKEIKIKNIVIVISGDITFSGEKHQFVTAKKFVGSLILKLNQRFNCICNIIVVPGNHDVNHGSGLLNIYHLKKQEYNEIETSEYNKLKHFYSFAKLNHCFKNNEIYYAVNIININGICIKVNLINNAIFSTIDQYKGLLYIPSDAIEELSKKSDADFIITVMHHAPDFYRDEIKNRFEDGIIKSSNNIRMIKMKSKAKKSLQEEFYKYVLTNINNDTAIDFIDKVIEPYSDAYNIIRKAVYTSTENAEKVNHILKWLNSYK